MQRPLVDPVEYHGPNELTDRVDDAINTEQHSWEDKRVNIGIGKAMAISFSWNSDKKRVWVISITLLVWTHDPGHYAEHDRIRRAVE